MRLPWFLSLLSEVFPYTTTFLQGYDQLEAFLVSNRVHLEEVVMEWCRICDLAERRNETNGAKAKTPFEEKEELENKILSMQGELETCESLLT